MTPERDGGDRRAGGPALWAAAALAFVAALAVTAVRVPGKNPGLAIGVAAATGLIGLVIAVAGRFAWTRYVRRRGAVLAPSLLVVAAAAALLVFTAGRYAQSADDSGPTAEEADECVAAGRDPLPRLPDELAYEELSPDQEARIQKEAAYLSESGTIAASKQVFFGSRPLGTVTAIPGVVDEAARDDFLGRVREAALRLQGAPESVEIGNEPAVLTSIGVLVRLATTSGCYGILLSGGERGHVLYVARTLFGDSSEPTRP